MHSEWTKPYKERSVASKLMLAVCLVTLWLSQQALGASSVMLFQIEGLVFDANPKYNGCLVRVSPNPADTFGNCGNNYITLGCDGLAGPTRAQAAVHLNAANLAWVTETKVYMRLYDSTPVGNAYCLADRVDNTRIANDP